MNTLMAENYTLLTVTAAIVPVCFSTVNDNNNIIIIITQRIHISVSAVVNSPPRGNAVAFLNTFNSD